MQGNGTLSNANLEGIGIANPTTYGIQIKAGLNGKVNFKNVVVTSNQYNVPRIQNLATGLTLSEATSIYDPKAVSPSFKARFTQVGRTVHIDFIVPQGRNGELVKVSVFQMDGKRLGYLENTFAAGAHRIELDASEIGNLNGYGIITVESGKDKQFFSSLFR
jgi:hypothetical protein